MPRRVTSPAVPRKDALPSAAVSAHVVDTRSAASAAHAYVVVVSNVAPVASPLVALSAARHDTTTTTALELGLCASVSASTHESTMRGGEPARTHALDAPPSVAENDVSAPVAASTHADATPEEMQSGGAARAVHTNMRAT